MVNTINLWQEVSDNSNIENIMRSCNISPICTDCFPSSVEDRRWILDNSNKTNASCQPVFEWFFNQNHIGVDEMPDYMCVPIQCEILHNYRLRYFILKDNHGIFYLSILKLNDPIGHKPRFVLPYRILPSVFQQPTDDIENLLVAVGIEKESVVSDENPYNYTFYNLEEDAKRMMSSKWRSKHGINKLSSIISVTETTEDNITGVVNLLNRWAEVKGHGGTTNHIKCAKLMSSEYLIQRVYSVGDVVIGYSAITKFCNNYFVMICKHVGQLSIINDKFICDHIGDYIIWDLHKMMLENNICGLFYFGAN